MRQNLTNIAAKDLESLEHFYIVGSTTKEGLIEGRSNVKIDLKKAIAEGGGDGGGEQSFDAKKFGDDIAKYIYTNLPDSTVFPDMYCMMEGAPNTFLGPPGSDVEFAAIISGAVKDKLIIPLYLSVPDSDKTVLVFDGDSLLSMSVTETETAQVEVDGVTYYGFYLIES